MITNWLLTNIWFWKLQLQLSLGGKSFENGGGAMVNNNEDEEEDGCRCSSISITSRRSEMADTLLSLSLSLSSPSSTPSPHQKQHSGDQTNIPQNQSLTTLGSDQCNTKI